MDIHPPQPVKLICGMISGSRPLLDRAAAELETRYGPIDLVSETWPFDFTRYYEPQMGPDLLRQFVAFERLAPPGCLAEVKQATNALEADLAGGAAVARPINLDPGYLTPAKLVLASCKDFAHRLYLGGGIYAEVTMQYRNGWQKLDWTFPDYASGRYSMWMSDARNTLMDQLREAGR
ncbi:MAG: DUF4416 family protein [Planctomycetes bacterium]|jgi:hypothetical protein|nr:DUF4416 family protein [Planctomycetota bacterium]